LDERASFLERACGGDDDLRREIESLLASFEESDSIIQNALADAAQLLASEKPESMLGRQLAHYKATALLGEGGMGAVYLALDTKLGRKVALKLLPSYFITDPERQRRFEQEACAASMLNHPNILTIYEIGEIDGTRFIATELIEGVTLRARMKAAEIAIGEVLDIVEQIASALAAAHDAGIIHRDIKPENVMIRRDALVKVLDFGLAKLKGREDIGPESTMHAQTGKTSAGLVMGTVPYMSPEQVLGCDVDHRSDFFSLGVLLYEMATGRSPFAANSTVESVDRILHAQPEATASLNAKVPPELDRVVRRCLEKDRERRYGSAEELLADLKKLKRQIEVAPALAVDTQNIRPRRLRYGLAGMMILAIAAGVEYRSLFRGPPDAVPSKIKSLAVLPLGNLSGDPAQEYFADGMTEALINNLARIRALKVISRTSAMRYKRSLKSLPEIARELNVDAVIEGAVQRSTGRVRVTTQLIHAASDTHLWAREYESDVTDVLKLESDIAREVADEVRVQVTTEERVRLASARRVNVQAHEAYLLGRHHSSRDNEQGWKHAIEYFQRAIELAPDYAAAYAELSDAWLRRGLSGARGFKQVESPARSAALRAIELDDRLAEAHISLSRIKQHYDWDWPGAEREIRRALELDPGSPDVHTFYGYFLMHLGRHDEAIREGKIVAQLDPLSPAAQSALGRFLYFARRYEEALPHQMRAVELEPRSVTANFRLGDVYAQLGKYDEAIAAYSKNRELELAGGSFQAAIARVYALIGRKREARQMINGAKSSAYGIAGVYAALGDKDEAFRILEKAVEEHQMLTPLKVEPPLDDLHSDPRWKALLRRMNFPQE
jgi:serine/threonine protein kinase/Flp pilus assembly protein TadD